MHLNLGSFAILISALFILALLRKKLREDTPSFPLSSIYHVYGKTSFRVRLSFVTELFFWIALVFIGLSLTNPTLSSTEKISRSSKKQLSEEGLTIYLLIDRSSSMVNEIKTHNLDGGRVTIPKIDLVRNMAKAFIIGSPKAGLSGRPSDLIGLIEFARKADVISPPTYDRDELLKRLSKISVVKSEDEDGTSIGYAIFKTVNLMVAQKHFGERYSQKYKPAYTTTSGVIIVLTDGLQSTHPGDFNHPYRFASPESAISYAEQNNVRVYYVCCDPVINGQEFQGEVNKLKMTLRKDNGALFVASEKNPLQEILSKIDQIEIEEKIPVKEVLQSKEYENVRSIAPKLLLCSLFFLILAILSETLAFRVSP